MKATLRPSSAPISTYAMLLDGTKINLPLLSVSLSIEPLSASSTRAVRALASWSDSKLMSLPFSLMPILTSTFLLRTLFYRLRQQQCHLGQLGCSHEQLRRFCRFSDPRPARPHGS